MSKQATFEVILGTYEEFLLGYYFYAKQTEVVQSFASHDHSSSIRSVAYSGNYLASGGADDKIFIYDLKTRKEHCVLTQHDSTISALQFTSNHSHVISGSSDGVLAIVRTGNWQLEKIWEKAHKGSAILDIAVHESGKLALTLGSDCSLRTWNLVKGRQAYVINLNSKSKDAKSLEKIVWAPDGVHFILYGGKYIEIWSIESGGIVKVIELKEKVCSCIWYTDEKLIFGLENGDLGHYTIESEEIETFKAGESRIKAIATYESYIVTVTSSGEFKIWNKNLKEIVAHNTGCRITCLCIVPQIKVKIEEDTNISEEMTIVDSPPKPLKPKVIIEIEDTDNDITNIPKKKKVKKSKNSNSEVNITEDQIASVPKKKKKTNLNNSESEIGNADNVVTTAPKTKKVKNSKINNSDTNNVLEDQTASVPKKKKKRHLKKCENEIEEADDAVSTAPKTKKAKNSKINNSDVNVREDQIVSVPKKKNKMHLKNNRNDIEDAHYIQTTAPKIKKAKIFKNSVIEINEDNINGKQENRTSKKKK
ncbi:p21-activated protein kinase-interacting protein 1-like [Aethina tumida]|uniref:p21-activated protein kinase-interacting protein 1-like n=1 Tax=Aethina tumida TaxID=116153 RepID=UPI002147A9E7|nr:p21-activated protein kinase-interacting protein 1-like [Aethina tumida]